MLDRFNNPALLEQALRHRSAGKPHNERLEFLGDAVLGLLVSEALYAKFPAASEGDLTQARSLLVREPVLADIGTRASASRTRASRAPFKTTSPPITATRSPGKPMTRLI